MISFSRRVRAQCQQGLDRLRLQLSGAEALPSLVLLGAIAGCLAGAVIVCFRLFITWLQSFLFAPGGVEAYATLDRGTWMLLPLAGGLLVGIALQLMSAETRQVGVVHVMERLAYHQGQMPLRNALLQFFSAAVSIASGHSVGREGPAVHLGGTSGSLLGQWLELPNNSTRTLVGCGTAAAIAASFNTPLAGVVFAMEVVMMEYTLAGFAPVIIAAVSATTVTQLVFGSAPAFQVPPLSLGSLQEMPFILVLGILSGFLAALFIELLQIFTHTVEKWPIWLRCTIGGGVVGVCAQLVPEIMGIGYDTVNAALIGQLGLTTLILLMLVKLLATSAALGLGLPGGLIGPVLIIGAAAGGAMGLAADHWVPGEISSPGFYALIGMAAMMSATLQAPLAALTAMLELTANPHVILPGMLAVIIAGLVTRHGFGKHSVFLELVRERGLDFRNDPVMQALRRIGVGHAMERRVAVLPPVVARSRVETELQEEPLWVLVHHERRPMEIMPAADLARFLKETPDAEEISLGAIPAARSEAVPVPFRATLQEAMDILDRQKLETAYVVRMTVPGIPQILGVLTREAMETSYRM